MTPGAKAAARPALLVLGAHGSGASALAGVLARSAGGASLAREDAGAGDAPGSWAEQVGGLNDRILAAVGASWRDWRPIPVPGPEVPEGSAFRGAAMALVATGSTVVAPVVIEDRRIGRVLPIWLDALAQAGCRPLAVLVHGSPFEAARSLRREEGFPPAFGLLLWLRQVLDAERHTRGLPRAFVSLDGFRADRRGTVDAVGDRLGLALSLDAEAAGPFTDSLSVGRPDPAEASRVQGADRLLIDRTRGCFEVMERWARHGEDGRDHVALDRVGAALTEAGWVFVDAPGATAVEARLAVAEDQTRALGEERDRQARELGDLARLLCDAEGRLDATLGENHALVGQVGELTRALDASGAEDLARPDASPGARGALAP